jgi:hypothetical protein
MRNEEADHEGSKAPAMRYGAISWWRGVEATVWRDEK